ncbi:3-ketoacyl-CoA thiolase 5, peroxisomal, partial [Physocladia obscura]
MGGHSPATPSGPRVLNADGVAVGCFVLVNKAEEGSASAEWHRAEILSIRGNGHSYYVHYDGFNKRLDAWVKRDRIDFASVSLPPAASGGKAQPLAKALAQSKLKQQQRQAGGAASGRRSG